MLTIWKFDGLQSHRLGKRSQMVKVAGQSLAGRVVPVVACPRKLQK